VSVTVGTVLAGYTILRRLGSGGMAEVYLAQHPRLPRNDALKVMSEAITADEDFRERFHREADLAATLWHPHIVGVHDRGEFEGHLWISMDYVEGTDAGQLVKDRYRTGMPIQDVCAIVAGVADALDYAHKCGLLHRDVKPANILLTEPEDGKRRVLLADFGIARPLADISGLTATNFTVGTLAYAAPEQLLGADIDGRADQYALAATAFHLLTGAPPFQHANPVAVIGQHLNATPPALSDRRPDLAHLDDAFSTALTKDPVHRFSRCRDFAEALNERLALYAESDESAEAGPTAAAPVTESPTHDVVDGPHGAQSRPHSAASTRRTLQRRSQRSPSGIGPPSTAATHRPRRRSLILLGAAIAVVVIIVIGVTITMIQPKSNKSPTPAMTSPVGSPPANPLGPPIIDPGALPPDGPPGPTQPMRQSSYCTEVGVLPGSDFRLTPKYMNMLNVADAWRFGRGAGVKVAVLDTGVTPHPRLPHLVGGGDYLFANGDGLSDCDAHGTMVASIIGAAPATGLPPADAFSGVAPDVELISLRQSSEAFTFKDPYPGNDDPFTQQQMDSIQIMARAIVHAANLGASVITIPLVTCMSTRNVLDQRALGAAIAYAAVHKDAVIVTAAGDTSKKGCYQNPADGFVPPNGPRIWSVNTVVTPAWFSDYVLTVGAIDSTGAPLTKMSVAGPWVSIAAPGTDVVALSPRDDGLINAVQGPNNTLLVPAGTSFSTAIVAGVAALVRAKYPQLSSHQIINRLIRTARSPTGKVDNQIGYGVVDPVAALTRDVPNAGR
jgi:type VII secretion-associated serine protease mycosin